MIVVTFNNFHRLNTDAASVARELINSDIQEQSPFQPFFHAWTGFNGWMESVTDATTDSAMITALADNRKMTDAFEDLLKLRDFDQRVMAFSAMWPVLNVRDVRRKLEHLPIWQYDRNRLIAACRRENVRLQPLGWKDGDIPTWPQVLRTIYLIRCNLFHGAKSPDNDRDRDLVWHANRVLRAFIRGSRCLDWRD